MYRLLLATDKSEIINAFNAVDNWERMGFRNPRIVTSLSGAVNNLKHHPVDAVAFDLPDADETVLMDHLAAKYPTLPILTADRNSGQVQDEVRELGSLLNRTHADFSNDDFGPADMMQLCRHEFFRALLDGRVQDEEMVRRCLRLLRSRMEADKPCVLVELEMPAGEEFLSGRWHYGTERLEIALRNFFGVELEGMRMLVSVLPDERIFLLAGAMQGATPGESVTGMISRHAQACIEHVREYLDLTLTIRSIRVMSRLVDLARREEEGTNSGHF